MTGFIAGLGLFLVANLIAVDVNSTGGLLEGLGIVDHWADDIRCIGFPLQFFEEGGFVYRRNLDPLALLLDIVIAVGGAVVIGFACHRWQSNSAHDDS